jgi:hypothetical protein
MPVLLGVLRTICGITNDWLWSNCGKLENFANSVMAAILFARQACVSEFSVSSQPPAAVSPAVTCFKA